MPIEACGTTVTLTAGDVFEVEYQAMHQPDGSVRVELRGDYTTDVVRESDGVTIDELDISGLATEVYSADGGTATFSFDGASIYGALDEVEVAEFATHGLPRLFYYESGNITERVVFPDDPAATSVVSAEILTDTARGVHDVCDMLDDAAEESGEEPGEESGDGDDGHSS
jgi:hypothetical protein